ncbi:MAG: Asp-tRNA(Asn)/Glu-tRNA(Gln) amidotransferase subunit GatA [Patescibacteria group bacterium]|nr:Asp-tRNA(Asn)/Glu-tRNA(Gln) amidotransferase subunit GatA [Patescibacteria group bacterium]
MELKDFTIKDIHQGLIKKEFSAQELARAYLERIRTEDEKINAFLSVCEDLAILQAKKVDEQISQGKKLSLLAGAPVAIKDNILVKNLKCTAGSKILEDYKAPFDASCIKKLKEKEVIILGKTNLDEFAMGSSTEHSAFKITRNPQNLSLVPGGSSGGSAAAVGAGECCFSLGSDTGGSIRQPASFCGVVGLKPTYGAVSRQGLIAFASSLDQIGPITKNVEDAEIVFEVIKGKDERDSTNVGSKSKIQMSNVPAYSGTNPKSKIQNLRIGVPNEYFGEGIDSGIKEVIKGIIKKMEKEGAEIKEISLPHTKYALACYVIIATSEASSNLARYDGIKYGSSKFKVPRSTPAFSEKGRGLPGRQSSKPKSLLDFYLKTRGAGFGQEVKRRIMLGTYALSAGYYEAYYLRAQKVRTKILEDFTRSFQKVDFIFTPVSPFLPFKIGEKIDNPLQMYLSDVLTVSVNLAGLPGLSLPVGKVNNLPVGLQIIGRAFSEPEIFKVGKFIESLIR